MPVTDAENPHARSAEQLEAALAEVRASPRDAGAIDLIVLRPSPNQRAVVEEATFDPELGVIGDGWHVRPPRVPADKPETQVTLMNARAVAAVAGDRERWALAGDQLYVDLDLGHDNLPPGSRLAAGDVVLEITAKPHTGCGKFTARFGSAAMRWVNSPVGRSLNLRGVHAKVIRGGVLRRGDVLRKV